MSFSQPPKKRLRVRDEDDDDEDTGFRSFGGRPPAQRRGGQRGLVAGTRARSSDDDSDPAPFRAGPKPEKTFVEIGTPFPVDLDALSRREANDFLPIWKQEVRDEKGRKRLHGAFTGGFSAGYFNTVGSKEGWTPSQFVSSRKQRASVAQRPEDFMDDEDLAGMGPQLQAAEGFDILGGTAQELGRKRTGAEASLGEAVLRDFIVPAAESMGEMILRRMGWREGQGIGPRVKRKTLEGADTAPDEEDAFLKDATFAPTDVAVERVATKTNAFGLGYEPHRNAPEFMRQGAAPEANVESRIAEREKRGQRQTGFGVGMFEDEDDEDVYDLGSTSSGFRRLGGPASRTMVLDEEEEGEGRLLGGSAPPRKMLRDRTNELSGASSSAAALQLGKDGKPPLRGFMLAVHPEQLYKWFPPPEVPKDFVPIHKFNEPGPIELYRLPLPAAALGLKEEPIAQLTPDQRRDLLGEQPIAAPARSVFSFMSVAEAEKFQAKAAGLKAELEGPPLVIPPLDSSVAAAALRGFLPFGKDPEKQERYRRFLQLRAGQVEDLLPPPPGMSRRDVQQELDEFARGAMIYKPLSGAMASRFTSGGSGDSTGDKPEDVAKAAAQMKQYGRLTRSVKEWTPTRLLCKRFNVAPPRPETGGASGEGRAKEKEVLNAEVMKELGALVGVGAPKLAGGGGSGSTWAASTAPAPNADQETNEEQDSEPEEAPVAQRPPMDLFKSIFGDSDDSDDDEDEEDEAREKPKADTTPLPASPAPETAVKSEPKPEQAREAGSDHETFKPTFRSKAERSTVSTKAKAGKIGLVSSSSTGKQKRPKGPMSINFDEDEGEGEEAVVKTEKARSRKRSRSRSKSAERDRKRGGVTQPRERDVVPPTETRPVEAFQPVTTKAAHESDSDDSIVPELPPDLVKERTKSEEPVRKPAPPPPKADGRRPRAADLFDDDDEND